MTNNDMHNLVETMQEWTLVEISQRQLLEVEFIVACVECGIADVVGIESSSSQEHWRFSPTAVQRMEKARRLQRDLELGLTELVLVLDLLDEVDSLRAEVGDLRKRLRHWEQA